MAVNENNDLFLNRRTVRRVDFRSAVRFIPDPDRPLRMGAGLTQNASLRGIQLLSPVILDTRKVFQIWIPLGNEEVIRAKGRIAWTEIEEDLGDSPYWVRAGLTLSFDFPGDKTLFSEVIAQRSRIKRLELEAEEKIGFIF